LLPVDSGNLSRALSTADRTFDGIAERYREELAPAIPRVWESQIEDIRWDIRGWLREMSQASSGAWTPRWFELSFGLPMVREKDPESRNDPVELDRGIRVRGAIDMVEERAGHIRITDHKTGKAPPQPPGLTGHGEVLQPVLYAQAAERILARPAESARLFFCTERGRYQVFDIPIDEAARQSLRTVITLIDRSVLEGFLPAAPREGACALCDFKPICGPYEETRVRRKASERLLLLDELRRTP
jgi:CRISPR/Cas system-associated exonuclease Cas4 (RecB family)